MLAAEMLQEFYLATISDQHPPTPFRGCSRWIKSSQRRKRGEEEDKKKQQKQQSTFCATAENLRTLRVSSYMEAHWLTLTIMQALPRPQKKPCR